MSPHLVIAIGLALLAIISLAIVARVRSYGTLRNAFLPGCGSTRKEMRKVRRALAKERFRHARVTGRERRGVKAAQRAHSYRVATATSKVAALEHPVGKKLDRFGPVCLYEWTIKVKGIEHDLYGTQINHYFTGNADVFDFVYSNGLQDTVSYNTESHHAYDSSGQRLPDTREVDPTRVREFAVRIENQIHMRMLFEQERPALLHLARQELLSAEADVSEITEAQMRLFEAESASPHKATLEHLARDLTDIRSSLGTATRKPRSRPTPPIHRT